MSNKKILVAPLDWGLGHAARCIPIIRALQKEHCEVQIAGAGKSLQLLKLEFSDLKFHTLPAYAPEYPKNGAMARALIWQLPKFLKAIRLEHACVAAIIKNEGINIVISDNRYGAWSREIPAVFITHQLNIIPPRHFKWIRPLLRIINYRLIKKFSFCWIPDVPTRKLTGDLTIPFKKIKSSYIGILSRFKPSGTSEKKYDILVLLSGPEPQRTILEDLVMDQMKDFNKQILLVRGLVGESPVVYSHAHIEVVNSLGTDALQLAIERSDLIIARSGYSTIMDLSVFQSKSILLPTPGQTEQLYLATKLHRKGIVFSCDQHNFQVQAAFLKAQKLKRPFPENDETLLMDAVKNLLSSSK